MNNFSWVASLSETHPIHFEELPVPLPTAKELAATLLEYHESATSKSNPQPLLLLSPQQIRKISGRKLLRGSVLSTVEGILHRKQVYFFRNKELYLLAPFGALTKVRSTRMVV